VEAVANKKSPMVVSAHSADFVWRAGGAIALYAERGWKEMNAEHLRHYYERVALQRGVQAPRNSNLKITYGEAYQRVFPHVTEVLG
jgi:LmbE family N-acetylglucosaminyl deacetylase